MATERAMDLERGAARFAAWRSGRERGERIPAALWELAVDLASRHGLSRTAQAVGVGYYSLQEHVAARRAAPQIVAAKPSLTLIEVPPPPGGGGASCLVEIEHPDGAKLRIQASAGATLDVAALVRAFRERG